jgi:hypothetical protein
VSTCRNWARCARIDGLTWTTKALPRSNARGAKD